MPFFIVTHVDKGSEIIEREISFWDQWFKGVERNYFSSCSPPYSTKEEAIEKMGGVHSCKICNMYINVASSQGKELLEKRLCWNCNFWLERADNLDTEINRVAAKLQRKTFTPGKPPTRSVIIEGFTYSIGPEPETIVGVRACPQVLGFGGREFRIKFFGVNSPEAGQVVVTHNLWAGGKVPERFIHLFPDNAIFLDEHKWVEDSNGVRSMT